MPEPTHLVGDGVELWFGGTDTPVPPEPPEMTSAPEFTVAVAGYRPGDRVIVRYVVEGRQGQIDLGRPRKAKHTDTGREVTFLRGELTGLRAGAEVRYTIVLERRYPRGLVTLPSTDEQSSHTYRFVFAGKGGVRAGDAVTKSQAATSKMVTARAAAPSPATPIEEGSTVKAAKLAGLPMAAVHKLAAAAPELTLLSDEAVGSLVSEGVMGEPDAHRLGLASVALHIVDGDEAAASKVMNALETHGARNPQDLASMTTDEMSSAIESAGVGTPDLAKAMATTLKSAIANAFPTQTLAATKTTPSTTTLSAKVPNGALEISPEALKGAWERNAGLDLLRLDLSKYSEQREALDMGNLSPTEKKAFIRDIQLKKDTLTVAGDAALAEQLLGAGLGSPITLASWEPTRIAQVAGLSPKRAATVHDRAVHILGRSANGLFTLWDALWGGFSDMAIGNIRRAEVHEFFGGLDHLEQLFGSQDYCQCEHCNSVLGPAAYFVDLLHFIQTHVLDKKFEGLETHPLHLKIRRPDLWGLPLTCQNTHTEIPQLQITSEIFENFLAKKRGIVIKPDRAEVVASVYGSILPSGRHSILQPFQLPLEELEIYLSHFALRRSDVMRLLEEPEEVQLRTELGISVIHAELIVSPDPSPVNIYNKLGLTLPQDGVLPMSELLKAAQLPRPELGEVLGTRFVGGQQAPVISTEKKSDESVQPDIEMVHGLTLAHLDRLHRFLRIKSHLTWSAAELDAFIVSAGGGVLDRAFPEVGRAVHLQRRFRASVEELCALAGDLPDFPVRRGQEGAPVDRLFNVPGLVREDGFYPNPAKRFILESSSEVAKERSMRLRAGLRLDEGKLSALVEGLSDALTGGSGGNAPAVLSRLFMNRLRRATPFAFPRPAPAKSGIESAPVSASPSVSFPMTARNLSLLCRHAILGRWLKLNPTDLLALILLTPGVGGHAAGMADCTAVVAFYDWWRSTPLSLEDLSILLAPPGAITPLVEDLWAAIQAWLEAQGEPALPDTFLTQIDGVSEELSREIVGANTGTVFEAVADGYRVLASWRDDAALNLGALAGSDIAPDSVRELIRSYHPDECLPHALTEALRTQNAMAHAVLEAALMGYNDLTPSSFLQPGPLPDGLRGALDALLRLHRIATSLRLGPGTLQFFAQHQTDFGITSWSEQNQGALRRIAALQAVIKMRFRDQPDIALGAVRRLLEVSDWLPEAAALLFDVDPVLARDLTKLRLPDNPIDRLFKLEAYAEMANKLSVNASALSDMASEEYNKASMAAAGVLAGFRAKYPDEETLREAVQPFEERVLEKKRDALIDYLLHGPDAVFPDANEMYKYFLIDGEVDGCFRTSRVVAATSSLQLYVHRIRMNLEKEPEGGLHVEPSCILDEEWEWRKHYRVWEANRKIFLWPENYLDPTIRDDKTPLFKELESKLLQQEITEQTVADAYANYLRALEELANLRYAGAYHHYLEDNDSSDVHDVIYLFGATGGEAPTHYWREIRNLAYSQMNSQVSPHYGPWQKVEARIPVRQVTPVVYDGQLHVFWNEITTISQNAVNDGKSRFIGYSHRYALKFTSLRLDDQWTSPERISLMGSVPAFRESNNSIDDPLAELIEEQYFDRLFAEFYPMFGIFQNSNLPIDLKEKFKDLEEKMKIDLLEGDPNPTFDRAVNKLLTPRFATTPHSKAQEGYTLSGFMWERPYVSLDPAYEPGLLVNCAGFLVRGVVDLFDRRVLKIMDSPDLENSQYKESPTAKSDLLAYRRHPLNLTMLRKEMESTTTQEGLSKKSLPGWTLRHTRWPSARFDYPVAAALALNDDRDVFLRHWGGTLGWSPYSEAVAVIPLDAAVWAVNGTPNEVIIETEDDLLLLQPDANSNGRYLLHRMGTTLVRDVARKLFTEGVGGLLSTEHQLGLSEPAPAVSGPRTTDMTERTSNPIANESAYGIYYQEIFLHIPLLLAYHLNAQGKFAEAQRWYHYVFDPTSLESPMDSNALPTDRNWKYRQFRGQEQDKLKGILSDTDAIQKYQKDPFNAHAIARLRPTSYQKAVVMRYIDNLLDWADDLFTRFQMESVNEAMMLYVTAAEILGPRPAQLGECGELVDSTRTYDKLKDSISQDGEFLLEVEELITVPSTAASSEGVGVGGWSKPMFGLGALLTFPISNAQASEEVGSGLLGGITDTEFTANKVAAKIGSIVSGDPGGGPPSASTVSMSPGTVGAAAMSGGPLVPGATAGAVMSGDAAKMSQATTSFVAGKTAALFGEGQLSGSTVASTAAIAGENVPGGRIDDGATSVGTTSFTKAALALPRTEALLQSFTSQQQFRFLGGEWKVSGGLRVSPTLGDHFSLALVRQIVAAFCIPRNELLDDYWNRVEDRIQKIRTCRDITGLQRKLSLFAPPIDPNLLARVRALGIPLDEAIGVFEGVIPQYRFPYLLEKAKAFVGTVQSFGAMLQAALERKDSEELVLLQATQQQQILALTTRAKEWEIESAQVNLEATERRRTAVENRRAHYADLVGAGLNEWETAESISTNIASIIRGSGAQINFGAAVLGLTPQIGSPFAMKYGGVELEKGQKDAALAMGYLADQAIHVAASAGLEAGHKRRSEDWTFQRDQAIDELSQIDKQIEVARIGLDLAKDAIKLHEKNIEHNEELREYHEDKFSALGLYTWLASELQRSYREAYNMAYRMARYAEQAYRFEREDYEGRLLSGGYWDASRAGLLAGNRLTLELQYLEQRYIETDQPKRELIDHVFSLRQWDPMALIELRQKGECNFTVPELFFDISSPGDYRRRIRSVRVTIPAVAGPYVNVMATLSLGANWIRTSPKADLQEAPCPRVDSITTSSARNDAGAFELNFHGDKYMPFEGAGAVNSKWSLSLPTSVRMFDYNTISDVLLHFDYTASFDGVYRDFVQSVTEGQLSQLQQRLSDEGIVRAFSLREEFPPAFSRLLAGDTVELDIDEQHLPFFARDASVSEATLMLVGPDSDPLSVSSVEFDGEALGAPTVDERADDERVDKRAIGVSIALPMGGSLPWKHVVRLVELSGKLSNAYLVVKLQLPPRQDE